jgi:hypothetical protein
MDNLLKDHRYPSSPVAIGIIGLGGNSRKIFGFKGLIAKVFENQ